MPPLFLEKNKRLPLHLIKQDYVNRSAENKVLTFHVSVALEDTTNLAGMPEWVQNAYTQMVKVANKSKKQIFEAVVDGAFVEIFNTPKTKQKAFSIITAATVSGFYMDRTGKDDTDIAVSLYFKFSFKARQEIYEWAFDVKNSTFYAQFEESQGELYDKSKDPTAEEEEEEEEDGDDEEEEEEDVEPTQDKLPIETSTERNKREAAALSKAKNNLKIM